MDQIKSKKHVFSKLFPFFKPYLIPLIGGFVLIFFMLVYDTKTKMSRKVKC